MRLKKPSHSPTFLWDQVCLVPLRRPSLAFTQGSKKNLQPDGAPDHASPAEKGSLSGEQQEVYYANLTFEGMKPWEPRYQEATSTHEYSEVKRAGQ